MKPRNYLGHNLYLCTLDQNNNKTICLWFHKTSNYIAALDLFIDNIENIGVGMAAPSKSAVGLIWLGRWLE